MPPERFNDAATSPQPPVPTLNKGAAEEPLQDGYESDTASIGSSLNDPPEICQFKLIFGGNKRLHYNEEELQVRVLGLALDAT